MKYLTAVICALLVLTGCSTAQKRDREKIAELETRVDSLSKQREAEQLEFDRIKAELAKQLNDQRIKLEMQDRGLVIILADNILFDSGRAEIKPGADITLNKIAGVLKDIARMKSVGIEGHTDNEPIKKSGWRSNRELSTARANNVCYYLEEQGVPPSRMTTIGYGEYRPVSANDTVENMARNRRVEIVILPEFKRKLST